MAAPTEDHSPRPYCRSRRGRNGLGSETKKEVAINKFPCTNNRIHK